MKKIPTTREQVLAAWEKTKAAANRLADARAKHEIQIVAMPKSTISQSEMDAFRAEHAERKRCREEEFLNRQFTGLNWLRAQSEMTVFRLAHFEEKRKREAEFSAGQIALKALKSLEVEIERAEKSLAVVQAKQDKAEKNYTP